MANRKSVWSDEDILNYNQQIQGLIYDVNLSRTEMTVIFECLEKRKKYLFAKNELMDKTADQLIKKLESKIKQMGVM